MAMINSISQALALATILRGAHGQSLVSISTFTDFKCNVASTTAENVSIPLGACVTTTGMVSFHMDALPCSGGGLTAVANWGFSDAHCNNKFDYVNYGSGCYGAYDNNHAFGSILLTCTDDGTDAPKPQGSPTTIAVGPTVTGPADNNTPQSGSDSSSDSSSDGSSTDCHGWSCLSHGTRIGIITGISVLSFIIIVTGIVKRIRGGPVEVARPVYREPEIEEYTKETWSRRR